MAQENSAEKIARLEREIEGLKKGIEALKAEDERLRRALEEVLRAGKRQAAPFSRREPKAHPQKPGRKAGKKYGRRYRRPLPEQVDEVVEVSCPGLEATRTTQGAHTQSVLVSILQACRQHFRSASPLLQNLICSPQPEVLDLPALPSIMDWRKLPPTVPLLTNSSLSQEPLSSGQVMPTCDYLGDFLKIPIEPLP